MEKLIRGDTLGRENTEESSEGGSQSFSFSMLVRIGHEECGDSAFVFCDDGRLIAGVLDGVSGEPGAASASSEAAATMLACLKKRRKASEKAMKEAMLKGNSAIKAGYTTATLLFLEKSGAFAVATVGDSTAYGIDTTGAVSSELPQSRPVGDDHSIFKYLYFRNLVTSVLGPSGTDMSMQFRKGVLSAGQMIVLASDGLSDNLYFKVHEGYVSDTVGTADLESLIKRAREPGEIIRILAAEAKKRMSGAKCEEEGRMLVPKMDDLALVAIQRK